MRANKVSEKLLIVIAAVLCLGWSSLVRTQDQDESKAIKAESSSRIERPLRRKATQRPSTRLLQSHRILPTLRRHQAHRGRQVGVTFWRFRRSTSGDKTKELVDEEEGGSSEWTLERIEEGTPLLPGQRV